MITALSINGSTYYLNPKDILYAYFDGALKLAASKANTTFTELFEINADTREGVMSLAAFLSTNAEFFKQFTHPTYGDIAINVSRVSELEIDTVSTTVFTFDSGESLILSGTLATNQTALNTFGYYVPYTGATTHVDIGSMDLIAARVKANVFRDTNNNNWFINTILNASNTSYIMGNGTVNNIQLFTKSSGGVSVGSSSFTATATLHVRGNSSTTGTAFLVQNSTPTDLFTVDNTGKIGLRPTNFELWFGTIGNASYANLKQVSGVLTLQAPNNSSTINLNGGIIGDYLTGANVYGVNITNVVNTRTITGTYSLLRLFQYISPTSGISNTNFLEISGTIQQTGGANGITRGILIAPTLTAAADFRGLEIVTGNNAAHTLIKLNNGTRDVLCVKGDNKIGLFNVTPTPQGTLALDAASYVNNGSVDTDTFNNYTLGQVVQQLQNIGILQ